MIFSDPKFIFLFLPIFFGIYHFIARTRSHHALMAAMIIGSIVFYGAWSVKACGLLVASVILNYFIYKTIASPYRFRNSLFIAGLAFNLSFLAYFKYANFFLENFCALADCNYHIAGIILPLGISFYTFQQIVFLVDGYKTARKDILFWEYVSFIFFFPHLVAGPIIQHNELVPQIRRMGAAIPDDYLWRGAIIFCIGLFKKIVIADTLAKLALPVFQAADKGMLVGFYDSWIGVLSFTFQIYFDFSAYSDMAIGLALMFGFILPVNFDSPYRARNIADFWRRWHITLSRFLRDNIYIPLGGNRGTSSDTARNLMVTMLIGGLWHGASWNFVLWGGLHGLALVCNKIYSSRVRKSFPLPVISTFLFVIATWTFFRAETFSGATTLLSGLAGLNGTQVSYTAMQQLQMGFSTSIASVFDPVHIKFAAFFLPLLYLMIRLTPSSCSIIGLTYESCVNAARKDGHVFAPGKASSNFIWAGLAAAVFVFSCLFMGQPSEFIYFEF